MTIRGWQPHLDLQRLLTALAEDLATADDAEVREAHASAGRPLAGAAQAVRERIAAASGGQAEPDPVAPDAAAARRRELACRPH